MKNFLKKLPKEKFNIPGEGKISKIIKSFGPTEKIIFSLLAVVFGLSALVLLWNVNSSFLVEVPARGGSLTEGVIGTPRFVNPVLALGDADRDLTALVYSGLLKSEEGGRLIPDLAKSYTISDDGLVYTFTLRDEIFFHDGTPVSADDIEFTIQKVLDPAIKSPKRASWEGVNVVKLNDKQIEFNLKTPYAPFIENTTIGIIPKHIWKNVDQEGFPFSQFNIEPVGAGPYKVRSIGRNSGGLPQYYELEPWKRYALGRPYIDRITLRFYPNEKAMVDSYENGGIESMYSLTPAEAARLESKGARVERSPLPRVFGVFWNQNQKSLFASLSVRRALNAAVPKERIVNEVLHGYGTAIDSPIPPGGAFDGDGAEEDYRTGEERLSEAMQILEKDGWKRNEAGLLEKKTRSGAEIMDFSISTSNAPELKRTAEILKEEWEKLGIIVTVKIYEAGDLNQSIIRPRKYDALLFGEIVGRDLDLFAFWHSSQRNDPGLNIALYVNSAADKLLSEARTISDPAERAVRYEKFESIIKADAPAAFTYSPDFIYVLPRKIKGWSVGTITTPADRFMAASRWYINTDKVWRVFIRD